MPIDFEGAYVSQGNTLSWMSNNTKKMRPPPIAAAIAAPAPAPAPITTADSFPALSSKAVASKQTPTPAKFSYAAAASSLSTTATTAAPTLPAKQLREGVSVISGKKGGGGGKGDEEIECWTLTSTREFGAANKVRNTIHQTSTTSPYWYILF